MKKIVIILLPFILSISGFSQNLNVQETLSYIEKLLNDKNNKSFSTKEVLNIYDVTKSYSIDYNYSLKVENGNLYIVKAFTSSYYTKNYEIKYFNPIVEEFHIPIPYLNFQYDYYSPYHDFHCKIKDKSGPDRFIIYNKSESSRLVTKVVSNFNYDGKETYNKTERISNIYIDYSNANLACERLRNAIVHLLKLLSKEVEKNPTIESNSLDPFAPKINFDSVRAKIITSINSNTVSMTKKAGVYEIPVTINGVLKLDFIFDAGASDVSISSDVAMTLIRTGTIKEKDFLGTETYRFADGSTAKSKVFLIREVQIGNKKVNDVRASISSSLNAPLLLGQSVLNRFGRVTIDYKNNTITFQE